MIRLALCRALLIALLAFSAFIFPFPAIAQDEDQAGEDEKRLPPGAELPAVIVTANRRVEPIDEITYPIQIITQEQLQDQEAQSALDALRQAPGVDITSAGSPGDDNDVRLLGSDRDEVLVLIDGVPINTVVDNRPTLLGTIPAENIERIEIIEGAQTGMYGSRAVGGVINIITKEGEEGFSTNLGFKAGNLGRFIEDAGISAGKGNHRVRAHYQRWDQRGRFSHDRFAQNNATINWRYNIAEDLTIQFSPQYFGADQELAFDVLVDPVNRIVYYPRDTNRNVERHTFIAPLSLTLHKWRWWEMNLDYNLYYQFIRLSNPPTGDIGPAPFVGSQYARGKEYRNRASLRNTFIPLDRNGYKNLATVGFDVEAEHISLITGPFGGPYLPIALSRENYAIFVQDTMQFKEYVTIAAGFRYDNNTEFGSEVTARASLRAHIPQSKTTFKFAYADTFNLPLITLLIIDPTLRPPKEKAQNYSVGVEQDLWDWGFISSFFFYKDYDSFFSDWVDPQGTADAYAMGIETTLKLYPTDWLFFLGSYTWTRARDEIRNVPLPSRPAHVWKASLTVEPIQRLIFRADLNVVGESYWGTNTGMTFVDWRGNVSDGTLDRYVRLDLTGRYTFKLQNKTLRELTLFTTVKNVLNQDYEEEYGRPNPGINFLSGVSAKLF